MLRIRNCVLRCPMIVAPSAGIRELHEKNEPSDSDRRRRLQLWRFLRYDPGGSWC